MNQRSLVFLLCAAFVWHESARSSELDLAAIAERSRVRHSEVPRKVLAFYYPWYGNPTVVGGSGQRSHWDGIEPGKQQIATSTNYPALGAYDSHDPQVIKQHCRWAASCDINGFIISWWGKGSFEDRAMGRLLDGCRQAGLQATVYYEKVPDPADPSSAVNDILQLLDRYGKHPAWLTVNGRPVIFVYGRAVEEIGLDGWLDVITQVNRKLPGGAVFLGDKIAPISARVFDGIHTYNTAAALREKSYTQVESWTQATYPAWVEMADARGRISTITVIPGYDDTRIRKPGLRAKRLDGALYRAQWQAAIAADPHWVLITSWNEWHEGSEIEPSIQHDETYLRLTGEFASRFTRRRERAERARDVQRERITEKEKVDLHNKFAGVRIGILPGADLSVVWPMVEMGIQAKSLSWEQVAALNGAAGKTFDLLVYAAGEQYRQTVTRAGDVDEGLLRYLRAGGFLAVFATGPMPFFYNEKHQAVDAGRKLGLPLSLGGRLGGWEEPPEGVKLRFFPVGNRLPHLSKGFGFPASGDLRWRPFVRSQLSKDDLVIPLLELKDQAGKHYGDAIAFVEHRRSQPQGGNVFYAWSGLPTSPHAGALLYDALTFIAERVKKR